MQLCHSGFFFSSSLTFPAPLLRPDYEPLCFIKLGSAPFFSTSVFSLFFRSSPSVFYFSLRLPRFFPMLFFFLFPGHRPPANNTGGVWGKLPLPPRRFFTRCSRFFDFYSGLDAAFPYTLMVLLHVFSLGEGFLKFFLIVLAPPSRVFNQSGLVQLFQGPLFTLGRSSLPYFSFSSFLVPLTHPLHFFRCFLFFSPPALSVTGDYQRYSRAFPPHPLSPPVFLQLPPFFSSPRCGPIFLRGPLNPFTRPAVYTSCVLIFSPLTRRWSSRFSVFFDFLVPPPPRRIFSSGYCVPLNPQLVSQPQGFVHPLNLSFLEVFPFWPPYCPPPSISSPRVEFHKHNQAKKLLYLGFSFPTPDTAFSGRLLKIPPPAYFGCPETRLSCSNGSLWIFFCFSVSFSTFSLLCRMNFCSQPVPPSSCYTVVKQSGS